MKILHFSVSEQRGAFEATHRLHKAFQDQGHESIMIVQKKRSSDNTVIQCAPFFRLKKVWNLFSDIIIRSNPDYYFLNSQESISNSHAEEILRSFPYLPDVIMLHWVSGFVNMKSIYEIQKKTHAKIFWLMLDMAPMTGGFHYAWQFYVYKKHCR